MRFISKNTQEGALIARKTTFGEVGICLTDDHHEGKKLGNAIYWQSKDEAVNDLQAVIEYFNSEEDESPNTDIESIRRQMRGVWVHEEFKEGG